ncbi:MAG: AbrB family transcriptional regulator [Roseovarius sp.]|jgi:uncharacterized membrane protein AbrB (regulator of aidB expression)
MGSVWSLGRVGAGGVGRKFITLTMPFLAFAPGGQAEMTVLTIVVGADLGYVIVDHLLRMFLVITCAPLAAKLLFSLSKKQRA